MLGYEGTYCGLDVENSMFPAGLPWMDGFYLSVVSLTAPNYKKSWVLTHSENTHKLSYLVYDSVIEEIQQEIDKFDVIVGHNLKHDINVLKYYGVDFTRHKLFCTMVAEYLLKAHERGITLNELAERYGYDIKDDRVSAFWDSGTDTAEIPLSILVPYCEHDTDIARQVGENHQYPKMLTLGMMKLFALQMEFMDCLSDMEIVGFKWDKGRSDAIQKRFSKYRTILERKLISILGIDDLNIYSSDDLSCALYGGYLKRTVVGPVIRTKNIRTKSPYLFTYKNGKTKVKTRWIDHKDTKVLRYVNKERHIYVDGAGFRPAPRSKLKKSNGDYVYYQTNKEVLPRLKCRTTKQKLIVALLLKLSAIAKVVDTFEGKSKGSGLVRKIARDGNIHTSFNQTVTATGRLSSSNPNGQNLPRGNTSPIKKCIIPQADGIMNADLSQIEWRVPAQLSQDPKMIYEINHDVDQHIAACKELMELPFISKSDKASKKNRDNAKIFNFRMIYGGTEFGFHMDPKMPRFGLKKWRKVVDGFYNKYGGLKNWQDGNIISVIVNHGSMVSPTGRRFLFPFDHNGKYDERKIKNYPVQGMAGGDILPLTTVLIRRYMRKYKLRSRMILTVHDSIVFDYYKSEEKLLTNICMHVFTNLPRYIRQYFGIEWNVNLTGEVEVGKNYGSLKQIAG